MSEEVKHASQLKSLLKRLYFDDVQVEYPHFHFEFIEKNRKLLSLLRFPESYAKKYYLVLKTNKNTYKRKLVQTEKGAVQYLVIRINDAKA